MDKVCALDWVLLLEYIKAFLSWPPMALVIAILFITRFRDAINDLLGRVVEGKILGQEIKAAHPKQTAAVVEDMLAKASVGQVPASTPPTLPPELIGDPNAPAAIEWVKNNPTETVVEYKKLMLSYGSERLFNRIYGTQIELLKFLAHSETPVHLKQLATFHEEHQTKAGSAEYFIKDYVGFLLAFGVIKCEGEENSQVYSITNHGVEFLSYIKKHYPQNQRPY